MLSDSWLKVMHPCLVFVIVYIRDKGSLRRRLVMIKTKNQMTKDVQFVDSPEGSDGPYLITIVHHPCRVIYSLHSCLTVPYLIIIVHYPSRVCYSLHSFCTVPYLIIIVHYPSRVCYYLYSCCPLHYLVCFC